MKVAKRPADNGFANLKDARYLRLETPNKSEAIAIADSVDNAYRITHRWNCHEELAAACKLLIEAEGAMLGTEFSNKLIGEALVKARTVMAWMEGMKV